MADEENVVKTETHLTEEAVVKFTKAEKKSGKRIGFNYVILKSLKESKKNDVVKCLYIKSLFDFGICVIKEGTYGDIKDSQGRDIKDRLMWQRELHLMLQDRVRVPRLLGSFEENGNYYLVIERIKGKPLANFIKETRSSLKNDLEKGTLEGIKCLSYLEQICVILSRFHEQGIVHRDVSANNFIITPGGKIAAIDLELSYSLDRQYPSPPFMLGTRGYMSPEQEAASKLPTEKEDVYSLGVIILQAWSGISAIKLNNTNFEDVKRKVPFFISDKELADIVTSCLHPDPIYRPSAKEVWGKIVAYRKDIVKRKFRVPSTKSLYSRDEIIDTIQQGIKTLASPLLYNSEKGWFSDNIRPKPREEKDKIDKAWYGSFGVGAAGIIYFLMRAKAAGLDISSAEPAIQKGWETIGAKYKDRLEHSGTGLHNGSDGISAVLSYAIKWGVLDPESTSIEWMEKLLERRSTRLNLADGLAGQGIANLICREFLPEQTTIRLREITGKLIESQHPDGGWMHNNRMTKGFNSGAAGIIYFLLEYGYQYKDRDSIAAAERGLNWLMKEARKAGESYYWVNSKDQKLQLIWCEGTVGIGFTFLRAYNYLKNPSYKEYGIGALMYNTGDLVKGELSQCHGLCGLGEVHLDAYAVLKDEYWLDGASEIAQTIMSIKKVHRKHGPFWLVGSERVPVANFEIGNSGVLYYLLRYCYPDKLHVPLLLNTY